MKCYPEDEGDRKELAEMMVEPWMAECLKLNPEYVHWSVGDDYMKGVGEDWDSGKKYKNWKDFGPWELDELNELVHFAFELYRESKNCETCAATGYHPDAQWVEKSWYRHASPFVLLTPHEEFVNSRLKEVLRLSPRPEDLHGHGSFPSEEVFAKYKPEFRAFCEAMRDGDGYWSNKLIQEEVDALVREDRLVDWTHTWTPEKGWEKNPAASIPSAAEINAGEGRRPGHVRLSGGHDAINQMICVRARCERFGIPVRCVDCDGHGWVHTAPKGTLGINLWILHPRKGCDRGIAIREIDKEDLPKVFTFLREGAKRNAERFQKVVEQDIEKVISL